MQQRYRPDQEPAHGERLWDLEAFAFRLGCTLAERGEHLTDLAGRIGSIEERLATVDRAQGIDPTSMDQGETSIAMVYPKDLNPEDSPQAYYGAELRRAREGAGLSQERLGELVYCSGAYIGQLETAVRKPQLDLSRRIDELLRTGGYLERLCAMVLKVMEHVPCSTGPATLERQATTISHYAPSIVPALLQTPDYARAIAWSANPVAPEEEIESRVAALGERARLLGPQGPAFWAVLHESVLHTMVGNADIMRTQLAHIAGLIRRRQIVVQIVPFLAGAGIGGPLCLLTFDNAPPVARVEGPHACHLLDSPALVAQCEHAYDLARADALSREASLHLLATAADGYQGRYMRELA